MTENERRVHESLRAMERGDVEWIAAQAHPDVEFINPPYALEPGTRTGIEGVRNAFATCSTPSRSCGSSPSA
jgi:ketosteroid isomerase-like protein